MPSKEITVKTRGAGLYEITDRIEEFVSGCGISAGLCNVFLKHTSASLVIQENADPSARSDLEVWFKKMVPENNPDFTHTLEGPDDMPSHIKAALTATSISVPIVGGALALGTWQGIYLFEHRRRGHSRRVLVTVLEG
ncbi:MAG: YjbQ family protein [Candidatus Dadabacteria bacterium]|nr:MAG: YjbQ family protein [Candidatus Dadabacteria bacterium]